MVTIQQRVYEPIAMGEYPATVTTVEPMRVSMGLSCSSTLLSTRLTRSSYEPGQVRRYRRRAS